MRVRLLGLPLFIVCFVGMKILKNERRTHVYCGCQVDSMLLLPISEIRRLQIYRRYYSIFVLTSSNVPNLDKQLDQINNTMAGPYIPSWKTDEAPDPFRHLDFPLVHRVNNDLCASQSNVFLLVKNNYTDVPY